jgi:hypothetical protein
MPEGLVPPYLLYTLPPWLLFGLQRLILGLMGNGLSTLLCDT